MMVSPDRHPSLEKLKRHAEAFGWRCLSGSWAGYHARYLFECAHGHRFERMATPILYRSGMPQCSDCEAQAIRERWMATLAARGGELVKGAFMGLLARYRLRCAAGHEWEAQGRKISEGSWCPRCAAESTAQRKFRADGLERLQAQAQKQGGRCLSSGYTGTRASYLFECAQGHQWRAVGGEIMRGSWCARCADKARGVIVAATHFYHDGLQRLQDAARKHGGECLATEYIGAPENYRFRCAQGHEWEAVASQIWLGHWCLACARLKQRWTIGELREMATARGGRCLSDTYLGKYVKHTWECHRGHVWATRVAIIRAGSWCPLCANLERSRKWKKRLKYDFDG
ncbi:conserved hypothetical protein [Burkholderia sp. H160]|nr:conserved hypothetical protein [Burkholderia sp. H160]